MKKSAFTLIELLITIAVISILATVVMFSLGNMRSKALNSKRQADLDALYKAVKLYYTNEKNTVPPVTGRCRIGVDSCVDSLINSSTGQSYIGYLPKGPEGKCSSATSDKDLKGECYWYSMAKDMAKDVVILSARMTGENQPIGPYKPNNCGPGPDLENLKFYCLSFPVNQ